MQQEFPGLRIVHRLDMATSGLMVLARDAEAHRALSRQFEQRQTEKSYLAIVAGTPPQPQGEITYPLLADWPNRPRQKVDFENGKPSLTRYRLRARHRNRDISLLTLSPVTGRSHQLRVHLAALGHPILGCAFYAPEPVRTAAPRLLLHASALTLTHPSSQQRITFSCEPDFWLDWMETEEWEWWS